MLDHGALVISLDFELYWGVRDKRPLRDYRSELEGVWIAIPKLLAIFEAHGIHATWATVGFLFYKNRDELLRSLPKRRPQYDDVNLSPYDYLKNIEGLDDRCHFAPELIRAISRVEGQEVGTHTFSHYYCLESGQAIGEYEEDLRAAIMIAREWGLATHSLVFPRNQSHPEYVAVFKDLGGKVYRGNEKSAIYQASSGSAQNIIRRAARLLDAYFNLSGANTYRLEQCYENGIYNIPSSRFFRPYSKSMAFFDALKIKRIKDAMTYAAKNNEIFHLWWHPHNFGKDLVRNLGALAQVLQHFDLLSEQFGMRSMNMSELVRL